MRKLGTQRGGELVSQMHRLEGLRELMYEMYDAGWRNIVNLDVSFIRYSQQYDQPE